MSRAYCLTCNEQVHETPSGTCPLGHPVAAEDVGPEPWVGFAGDTETDVEVQMQRLDVAGRPREHAGVGQHTNGTAHVNGSVNGHAAPFTPPNVALPPMNGSGNDHAGPTDDDLSALLAEALRDSAPPEAQAEAAPVAPVAPVTDDTDVATPEHHDADWGELASLAAELHLDEDVATDDGPVAPPPAAASPVRSDVDEPSTRLSTPDIDDLLAELTGGSSGQDPTADAVPPQDVPGAHDAVAPEPSAPAAPPAPADLEWLQDPTPTPPPPPAPPAATVPPPPPPAPRAEPAPIWDAPPPPEDVPSAPTADPSDIWAEPDPAPPVDDTPPASTVDLYNFTARGTRVGDGGTARPARKKRGRKR